MKRLLNTKRLTVVLDLEARGGVYSPEIHIHRRGKNDSVSGFGPKFWPVWARRIFVGKPYDFGGMLTIRVPHVTWRWAYAHDRCGIRLYQLNHRLLRKAVGR